MGVVWEVEMLLVSGWTGVEGEREMLLDLKMDGGSGGEEMLLVSGWTGVVRDVEMLLVSGLSGVVGGGETNVIRFQDRRG